MREPAGLSATWGIALWRLGGLRGAIHGWALRSGQASGRIGAQRQQPANLRTPRRSSGNTCAADQGQWTERRLRDGLLSRRPGSGAEDQPRCAQRRASLVTRRHVQVPGAGTVGPRYRGQQHGVFEGCYWLM